MKTWTIPVTWEVCSTVEIEANTLEEALDIARDEAGEIPCPTDADYVDGSWSLSLDDEATVRAAYNNNQPDDVVEILYCVCAIGYDSNDCVTDFDREYGEFASLSEAQDKFNEIVQEAKNNPTAFFSEDEPVAYWHIQLEKCERTEDTFTCIDFAAEEDIFPAK